MNLQEKIDPFIVSVVHDLQQAGYEAYIVGGAVRDLLLERVPKDYDVTTSATPEQVRKVFRPRFRTMIIGRRFQLVHLYSRKGEIIEISTFRKRPQHPDLAVRPARCADAPENMIFRDNEFGTAEDDAHRRDFTVNALFYDPVNDRIRDYTGLGMQDLKDGVVRCIGEPGLRFEEDPVRLLRAVKLVGQYGFRLEEKTDAALASCMGLIVHASVSRLSLELEKILKNAYSDRILRAFHQYGLLQYFLPYLDRNFDTPQMDYLLDILAERNRRILSGAFRASLSSAIAIYTIPFAEREIGRGDPGCLWDRQPGIEVELKCLIIKIFHPLVLTHRMVSDTLGNLLLQPRLYEMRKLKDCCSRTAYVNARELACIQNMLNWQLPDFEQKCPPAEPFQGFKRKRRPRRRHFHSQDHSLADAAEAQQD